MVVVVDDVVVAFGTAVVDVGEVVAVGCEDVVVGAVAAVSEVASCRSSSSSIFFCSASISELVELPQPLAAKANITRSWSARTTQLCNSGRQLGLNK